MTSPGAQDLHAFAFFLGHQRSGTTLLANLLDAHPDASIAFQYDAIRAIDAGVEREPLFQALLVNSAEHAAMESLPNGYSYELPGEWRGRVRVLRVVGDKKAAGATHLLSERPCLLERVRACTRLPIRVIQVVRNPFDVIATITRRTAELQGSLERGIAYYLDLAARAEKVRSQLAQDELQVVRHEALVADPQGTLAHVCGWLELDVTPGYLTACAGAVFASPRQTRHEFEWPTRLLDRVHERIESDKLLRGYAFLDEVAAPL